MSLERIVLGTRNPGKLSEWTNVLREEGFNGKVLGVSDIGDFEDPRETGETFGENARQKATHYAKLTGEYTLSEDGGYEVDALGGAPGVHSRRILPGGNEGTDEELIDFVLE
ncbi:non-canonical purine NTP pyrophosphatase, partial [Candidatus Woesebacteria bacterium]|nr:non-canonical purine NTP pyrophosphatase [Candidatus Woesebacteria bacterium]